MLNFGEEIIFSRVLPVFDKPANPGEYKEKNIQKYAVYKYPQTRKKAMKVFGRGYQTTSGLSMNMAVLTI